MRLTLAKLAVGLAWSVALASGSGCDLMAPPPSPPPIAMPETAKTIFMITPWPPEADPEGWVIVAQTVANRERLIFRSLGHGPRRFPGRRAVDGPPGPPLPGVWPGGDAVIGRSNRHLSAA